MTKEKISKETEVLAVLSETPLAGFINALRTGEFQPPPDEPIAPNETLIGELTDIEKAMYSATVLLKKQAKAIAIANNTMVKEADRKGEKVDDLQVFLNKAEHEATTTMYQGILELLWCTIEKRIGAPIMMAGSFGIRNGFQLVSFRSQQQDVGKMFTGVGVGGLMLAKMLARGR